MEQWRRAHAAGLRRGASLRPRRRRQICSYPPGAGAHRQGRPQIRLSLALVTQRPSELDPTILSQCATAIALRLSSEHDQQVIRANTYEGMVDLIDFLPLLGDREALILGQGVSMPMRISFDEHSASGPKT